MSRNEQQIWFCKIGEVDVERLPRGADVPMREAIRRAYLELTGVPPTFIFSGWNAELTEGERLVATMLTSEGQQ